MYVFFRAAWVFYSHAIHLLQSFFQASDLLFPRDDESELQSNENFDRSKVLESLNSTNGQESPQRGARDTHRSNRSIRQGKFSPDGKSLLSSPSARTSPARATPIGIESSAYTSPARATPTDIGESTAKGDRAENRSVIVKVPSLKLLPSESEVEQTTTHFGAGSVDLLGTVLCVYDLRLHVTEAFEWLSGEEQNRVRDGRRIWMNERLYLCARMLVCISVCLYSFVCLSARASCHHDAWTSVCPPVCLLICMCFSLT